MNTQPNSNPIFASESQIISMTDSDSARIIGSELIESISHS